MEITWLTKGAFKIKDKKLTVLFNPYKDLKLKKGAADVSVLTHSYLDDFNKDVLNESYIADWPGEYEVGGLLFEGVEVPDVIDGCIHTVQSMTSSDKVTICHAGELRSPLPSKQLQKLGHVDILIVPVYETEDRKIKDVKTMIDDIEPAIVIPAYWESKEEVEKLAKELGLTVPEAEGSYKHSSGGIAPEGASMVLLSKSA